MPVTTTPENRSQLTFEETLGYNALVLTLKNLRQEVDFLDNVLVKLAGHRTPCHDSDRDPKPLFWLRLADLESREVKLEVMAESELHESTITVKYHFTVTSGFTGDRSQIGHEKPYKNIVRLDDLVI